jgi:hypothetical protein
MKKKAGFLLAGLIVAMLRVNPPVCLAEENHHREENHDQAITGHDPALHKAHHGGVLNVIGTCETGHIEIRLSEDTLEAWVVGGGHDTDRSVPIEAEEISLTVNVPGRGEKTLVLKADPMKLAGEKVGHCSHFVGTADWLLEVEAFEATGAVFFKGFRRILLIKYPGGYDPEHSEVED